jgi:hypothetical protein
MTRLILLGVLLMAGIIPTWAQQTTIQARFPGDLKTTTLDCKSTATVTVTYTGNYVASVNGGAMILDATGKEVPILVTAASTFQVKASFGSGTIYVADPSNSQIIDSVKVTVTNLNTFVGNITGSACMTSVGSAQFTIPVDPRAGDVEYSWSIVNGGENTQIVPATRTSQTVTVNSLNAGTSILRVTVVNDCSGEFCSSPVRSFLIRKTLSTAERAAISITGVDCTSDDVLGDDNLVVLAVPPVLGRWDPDQYQWVYPQNKLRREFRSGDGSAIAFKVLDNSTDITVTLNLGPACNPGLTYTRVLRAPAPAAQIGIASNGYTASTTFCLPEATTTTETFRVLNNPSSDFQYSWIVPDAWQILSANGPDSTEVVVRMANTSPGTITVRSTNDGCGDELATLNINRFPATAPQILSAGCIVNGNLNPIEFTVAGGDNTYNWNVQLRAANGTLTPANWIPEDLNNIHGATIRYKPNFNGVASGSSFVITAQIIGNCGNGTPVISTRTLPIGPAAPQVVTSVQGAISTTLTNGGSSCYTTGQQYVLTSDVILFAANYTWSFSSPSTGWSFNPTASGRQVTVTAGSVPVTISVVATAGTGCTTSAPLAFTAKINPAKPGPITLVAGSDCISPTAAATVSFAVPNISGMTFQWVLPDAARYQILSGQGTNQIQVRIAAGADANSKLPNPLIVNITSASGCTTASDPYTIVYGNVPVLGDITRAGAPCVARFIQAPPSSNYTYEWYLNGVLTPQFPPPGNFYIDNLCSTALPLRLVVHDVSNGCSSERVFAGDVGCTGCPTAGARVASASSETSGSESISISPNPVSDQLNIELAEGDMQQLYLLDVSGKEVVRQTVSGKKYILDVQHIPSGIYHLIILGTQQSIHQKIVIQ